MKKQRFVIIDGNAIIHRAYHALPPLTDKNGRMVNAVYGFASMLLKVLQDLKPDYLVVSFDMAGGSFRNEVYKEYKATRVKADQDLYDQIPLVHEMVHAFQIPIFEKEGYEADDVIATVVNKESLQNREKIIVTGDKDLLQLVDDDTHVYLLQKGLSEYILCDKKQVEKIMGFGPERVVDYKALRGDPSDNIPGIKGIGEKTANDIISQFGGIEELYDEVKKDKDIAEKLKPAVLKKIIEGEESARMSKELATVIKDVPHVEFNLHDAEIDVPYDKVKEIFYEYNFNSLLKRLPNFEEKEEGKKAKKIKNLVIVTEENFNTCLEDIEKSTFFACKSVVKQENILDDGFFGFVFGTRTKEYFVEMTLLSKQKQNEVFRIFADEKKTLLGHDVKRIVKALFHHEKKIENNLFDIMIASYLTDSSVRAHDIQTIIFRELKKKLKENSDQQTLFGFNKEAFAEEVSTYFDLYDIYTKKLQEDNNLGLFEKIEMKLIPALAHTELAGICIDEKKIKEIAEKVDQNLEKVTKHIWKEAGEEFNIASSQQLREILFTKLQLPTLGIKKGKTGYSTAQSELEKLQDKHEIISLIEEHRELAKLKSTYVDVLPTLVHKKTGRIHTTFNQAVTTTGRLSSSDPNLQNIPIRTDIGKEIRDTFIAGKGNILLAADYSQIELRVIASMAKDENMIEIFKRGEDIHKATAAAINEVSLDEVTPSMRRAAKEVNFGVLYGMSAHGLSWRAKIPQAQAQEFIDKYFEEFSGVKTYIEQTLDFAKKEGYVETLFGRRRYIPELTSRNFQLRNAGERMAINMPIQGTAADIMKLAMIHVYESIIHHPDKQIRENTKILLQVHDELVVETPKGTEKEVEKLLKKEMEEVVKLNVPVEVHIGIGNSWGKIK